MSYEPETELQVPLHSVEAEMSALGSMLLSERAVKDLADLLASEDFSRPSHRLIFGSMLRLSKANKPIDLLTLRNDLIDQGDLASVGGQEYLNVLDLQVPSASNALFYGKIVKDKAMRRNALAALEDLERKVRGGEAFDVLNEEFRALPAVIQANAAEDAHVDLRKLLMEEESWSDEEVISSGNPYLDALTEGGGLACGQFSLSTAPTGEGKTTFAMSILFDALERGERCAYLSFTDLGRRHIVAKAIRWLTGLKGTSACRTDAQRRRVEDAKEHIYRNWDWEIFDAQSAKGARYVETAVAWMERVQKEGQARKSGHNFPSRPIRLAVWDYAQAIRSGDDRFKKGKTNFYQEQLHVAQEFRTHVAQMGTAHAIMCAQLTDDKDKEWIRECKEWEFGAEFWFRVKKESVAIKKRRFGGKTDQEPPHTHHPRRHTFVPEGGRWDGRFEA